MMVTGPIRDKWAEQSWEIGPLGYPVMDQYRFKTSTPLSDPAFVWTVFQNGAICSSPEGTEICFSADLSPEDLKRLVRKRFDDAFHQSPDNIGLQPEIEIISVSSWGYGFSSSRPREIIFRLHGFHDNGNLPDTTFVIDARLRFRLTWEPTFYEPETKTLIIELASVSVTANGLGPEQLSQGVANGISDAFRVPQKVADIPTGATIPPKVDLDIIDVLVTQAGGLQVLVNPIPENIGRTRQLIAQRTIAFLTEG